MLWFACLSDPLILLQAVQNFAGAVAIRFMLGVCEAAVTPGFALITSQYYTKQEQGTRVGIWFSFNGWAQIFGGLVAYGIAVGTDKHPAAIAGWKIVFLFTGLLTIVMGCIFLWVVPDSALNARWLKKEDRILAIERIRINQQGVGNKVSPRRVCIRVGLTADVHTSSALQMVPAPRSSDRSPNLGHRLLRSRRRHPERRHLELLLPAHQKFRLHRDAIAALWHPRRSD